MSEDAFLEEFAEIKVSASPILPTDFSNLIQKPIITVTVSPKPIFRRATSLEENVSPLKKKICQRDNTKGSFLIRRKKLVRKVQSDECSALEVPQPQNQLKFVSSEDLIKTALQRSYSEPDLIADFSRSYSLPLAPSRHQDLRAIDSSTLKRLLNGEFSDSVPSFKIIDCRYPYEYQGGHIAGAVNLYTHDQCSALLEEIARNALAKKPSILIFHCEFSAERGPNLYRHLRQEDRKFNANMYPALCFPEMYILEGGYRKFYEENSSMCSPSAYTRMLDPEFSKEMTFFRQTSKTWNCDVRCTGKKTMKNRNSRKLFM